MDVAPLRPVPARPGGPVSDPDAARHVAALLPGAAERDGLALALVALAGHPRTAVAGRLGLSAAELASSLTRARKELRRSLQPLPGSGWCELAERLVSDRIDGELAADEEPRLSAHLRNCPRCVEHERRLVQATDILLASLPSGRPAPVVEIAPPLEEPAVEEAPAPVRGWYALIAACVLIAVADLVALVAGAFG